VASGSNGGGTQRADAAGSFGCGAPRQIVMFNRLGEANMRAIVDVRLREMEQRVAGHKLKLVVPDDVKKWLALV